MGSRGVWGGTVLESEVDEGDPKQMWERPPVGDLPGKAAGQGWKTVLHVSLFGLQTLLFGLAESGWMSGWVGVRSCLSAGVLGAW